MGLTPKQQRFVEEYLRDLNAKAAYERSGYKGSPEALAANAARLIANDKVSAAIRIALEERSKDAKIDAAYVLSRLKIEAERVEEGASHGARVQALRAIGEHIGFAKPAKVAITDSEGNDVPISIVQIVPMAERDC